MKIGVTVRPDQPMTEAAAWARRIEDLGFDGVWLADHYFHRDVSGALALMMAATRRVTLGTAVMSPFLRHPTLLASMAASLREIGDGRFVLGLGAGGYEFASELGIEMKRPLRLTAEAVEIVRQLSRGTSDVAGETFSARGSRLRWDVQDGPLYLAARGPKMLELSGRVADGVITHGIAPSHVQYVRDHVATGAAGRTEGRTSICLMLDVEIGDDREAALAALRPRCTTMAGGAYADELIEVYGLDVEEVRALRATVRTGDRVAAAAQVTDAMAEAFGVAGPAGRVRDAVDALAAAGVDEVILSVGGATPDAVSTQLTQLAKAVLA
ncbi:MULTISPECIES: LLM class flavin-dependent oxidoreductase [unclassified Actinotalea]|uniref:LLM class flavin-dependent oxidoreductase n=1 Tax=unclassified Actinotalea TaxID=2638618 RepID=UPI0015F67D6D|nr:MULTISPECIES: LLM class flavin-dependent oxidoreductase [unclassified Actinotalea]